MEDYKGNSDVEKSSIERKPVAPVTSNVTVKPASSQDKPKSKFFAEDGKSVMANVVDYVVLPGIKKMVSDIVKQGVDWLIYGNKGSSQSNTMGQVSYSRYYINQMNPNPIQAAPSWGSPAPVNQPMPQKPSIYAVNDVNFNERADAEEVLIRLRDSIVRYGSVSVADFYDMINQHCSFTDQKYGWFDLTTAEVIRTRTGYSIDFPRVQPIEL
jgi:hypothetical protein